MNTNSISKINKLLQTHPPGIVLLSCWLAQKGYSLDLQKRYRKSNWLKSIGTGAMIRSGDDVGYDGAIYALQEQLSYSIHPGGRTALSLLGKAHYLDLAAKKVILFGNPNEKLPTWFKNYDWGQDLHYHGSSFLPANFGLTTLDVKTFSIKISSAERAIMECLYLAPEKQDLLECYELMEGLTTLRPKLVQKLLEQCRSVKVKRLFLFMAEKAEHTWAKHLNQDIIDLGRGKRSIVKNGIYIPYYKITVPEKLIVNDY
ncbi:MAG: type IV toxin-antitoxin system AbiEi family antitoxin [Pseudomonadota bacterium]